MRLNVEELAGVCASHYLSSSVSNGSQTVSCHHMYSYASSQLCADKTKKICSPDL